MDICSYSGSIDQVRQLRKITLSWQVQAFWSFDHCLDFLTKNNNHLFFLPSDDGATWDVTCLLSLTLDEADLVYLYTLPEKRGRGLAANFLKACLQHIHRSYKTSSIFLEVAVDNVAATSVYRKLSFIEIGRRKSYYRDGKDAIVMKLGLNETT